jgi:predicted  nucleic acid-binding Zn-ribbon protein
MSDRGGTGRAGRSKTAPRVNDGTLRRLQARGERLLQWFPELGKNWLTEGEPAIESVLEQLRGLRGQVSRRAQATGRDLEARAERLFGGLEKQAVDRLQPLLTRAQVASQTEIQGLERRVAHLEGRLGPLLDDRARLGGRVADLEHQLDELRGDVSERLRELQLRLSADDGTRTALAQVREHLDALSKEHVTRGLELGKLHDRIVRLEMRFGDLLKEQGTQLSDHEDMKKRLATLGGELEESARQGRATLERIESSEATARLAIERVTAIADRHALDRGELDRVARGAGDLERMLKQLDLRLGELAERHAAAREELAALAGRTRQLETNVMHAAASAPAAGHSEGH